jgi:hypothetical protein
MPSHAGRLGLFLLSGLILVAGALAPATSRAQAKAIATAETNFNATAELYECKRKQGVLSIKVRFKAIKNASQALYFEQTYVMDVGSGKKYEVLKDSDGNWIAANGTSGYARVDIYAGQTASLWWKFPAPPAETKTITFALPEAEPFEDVPITDAP